MRICCLGAIMLLASFTVVPAQPAAPTLDHTDAFERSYATSFYIFDACGDALGGRMFRQALVERFNQCPFTPQSRDIFRTRINAQRAKSSRTIQGLIENNGGLPMRLDGMTTTCREQQTQPEYTAFRARLDRFSRGELHAGEIVPAPCDADQITP